MNVAKVEQQVQSDFYLADWHFELKTREWKNAKENMSIKLGKSEASQITILRRKLCQVYLDQKLPNESRIQAQLDNLIDAKNAM